MAKYCVSYIASTFYNCYVDASNEEEAQEIADESDIESMEKFEGDFELTQIEELEV